MRRRGRNDAGSTHVLEAVIIASIMISAVAFVATFESPVSGSTPSRELLAKKASDAIQLLVDTPVKDTGYGDNLFSVLLAHCMQGDCSNMSAKLDKLLPPGASYALYVSNGYDTFPIHVTREPAGEAVTAKVLLEPHWSYTFTSTGLSVVNNETDPQLTYALPVYNSNVISPGGSPIKVIVTGKKQSDGSAYTLEAFYTTLSVDESRASLYPAASLNFLVTKTGLKSFDDLGGRFPGAYWDRYDEVMNTATGHPNNKSVEFRVQVRESAGVKIPIGTELTVNIPRGWNASGYNDETWEVLANATSWNNSAVGSDVVARLLRPIEDDVVDFRFNATYHGDVLRYYPFRASLSRGASAEANLLVEADRWPENTQTFAIPRVVASVPRPMGATAETTWSLAVNIPFNPAGSFAVSKSALMKPQIPEAQPTSAVSGTGMTVKTMDTRIPADAATQTNSNIIITEVTILEQDGRPIFGTVTPGRVGLGHGTWTSYGDRLVWRGMHNVTTQRTLNLTFDVVGSGVPGNQMPKSELLPPIEFSAFTGRLLSQTAPGFYRDAILPNNTTSSYYEGYTKYLGYDPAGNDLSKPFRHNFTSTPQFRQTFLPGNASYNVHAAAPFSDALYGSYVAVERRNVPIGGQVVLTADVQSMLYALSAAGQSAGVNLTFYPPWAGNNKVPIWSQKNLDSGILTSDVVQMVMLDVTGDGYPDPIVGTDQGRVMAFDGATGQRVQGDTWIAPVLDGDGVAYIRHLSLIRLGGVDYIAIGTDGNSGVYIIDKTFTTRWSWSKTADTATEGIAAMDTWADIDGDGRNDIVLALDNGAVYVLRAIAGQSTLQMLAPTIAPSSPIGAFAKTQGTPATMLGLDSTGPAGTPGMAVSLVSLPGADANIRLDRDRPEQTTANPQLTTKSPRAGMTVIDDKGSTLWTFLNTPVTEARQYDHNGDAINDILVGSNSGHVLALNGIRGAPPLTSVVWLPIQELVDGDARDLAHSVWLTEDGTIAFTYDGWATHNCVSCDPVLNALGASYPSMNGIAMNSTMGIWAAGDNSQMLRSTPGLAPGYPMMSVVVPNATKGGLTYNFLVNSHRFNDVHFMWGAEGDRGFAVGSPLLPALCVPGVLAVTLQPYCDEGLLMETTDGGVNWRIKSAMDGSLNGTAGPGSKVTKNLTRVNFTTSSVGWVVGEAGTLLRTTDGGSTWKQIGVPTTVNIRDISCSPTNASLCLIVGDAGVALRTENALGSWPTWTNVSAPLAQTGRLLLSAGVVTWDNMYVGLQNKILQSRDKGDTWTELPLGYIENNANRMSIFPDGSGYIWGGNSSNARQWTFHDFARSATARTTDVTGSDPVAPTHKVTHASAYAAFTSATGTSARVYLSADGGSTWTPAIDTGDGKATWTERSVPVALARDKYSVDFAQGSTAADCGSRCGRDVRVRIDMESTPDISLQSIFVGHLEVEVSVWDGSAVSNRTYVVDLSSTAMRHDSTTAVWNTDIRAIHLPLVDAKFWSRNVSGQVLDLQTGFDLTGDGRSEVWVSTGGVVAENSADYMLYAGYDPNRYVAPDNRIYLLDGRNGTILKRTASLDGNVTSIRLADEDGDEKPDWIFATVWQPKGSGPLDRSRGSVRAFDAKTLEPRPDPRPDINPGGWRWNLPPEAIPFDMELGWNETNAAVYVARGGYLSPTSNQRIQGGAVDMLVGENRWHMWTARSDERGQYNIMKDIPLNWFFGPYVVEVKVDWKESVRVMENGATVDREIVQSAQFYDYFMVTPPDALSPPSPVYMVHLVAWLDDWR